MGLKKRKESAKKQIKMLFKLDVLKGLSKEEHMLLSLDALDQGEATALKQAAKSAYQNMKKSCSDVDKTESEKEIKAIWKSVIDSRSDKDEWRNSLGIGMIIED